MSDELTIQPGVNPQIQPKKTSTIPYALGGAAVGAAAGWGASALYKGTPSAKSYEELIKDANEKDVVDLKAKKEALDKAEKELADAGKVVYDGKEKEALDKAIKARDEELARLTTEKKVTIKKGSEIVPFDPNWSMTDKQKTDYKNLYTKYEAAKNNLESSKAYTDLNNAISSRKLAINDMFEDIIKDAEAEIKPKSTRRKDIKSLDEYLSSNRGKNAIEDAITKHKIARLTDSEIIKLGGGEKALVDTKPALVSPGYKYIPVTAKDGSVKYAKVQTTKMVGRTEFQKLMEARTDEIAEKVSNSFKTYTDDLKKLGDLPKTMKIDKGLLRNLGIKRADVDQAFLEDLKINLKSFESDLKAVDGAKLVKNPATGAWSYDSAVQAILDKHSVDTPAEAKKVLDAKLGIGRKYVAEEKALLESIDSIVGKDVTLSKLENRMSKLKKSDNNLNKIESQIKGQFKKYIGTDTTTTVNKALTQEEAMKKDSYKQLAKVVEDKQAIYDKVAAEKGKVNETAKKAAEEAKNKAKSELDDLVKTLNSKVKGMSGGAKAAVIGGLAVVGGLIGANMAKSKNKNAEAAARQIIA